MRPKYSQKILLLFFIWFVILVEIGFAQKSPGTASLLQEAQQYFDQAQEKEALSIYLKVLKQAPDNFDALWHTSLIYARIGYRYDNKTEMRENYQKALEYAEQVLKLYPGKGPSHFVYAVANGRISDISDTQTQIKKSHIIKEHAEKAVELMPDYAPAWHLLGLWHSKVANISSAKKFAAGLISQGVPKGASNKKAVEYMQKAIQLQPEQILRFKLDLARHYVRAGQNQLAIHTLREVVQISPKNDIDEWNLKRAKALLEKLQ